MKRIVGALVVIVLGIGLLPFNVGAASSRYFPETGQTSSNAFYEFWQTHGGLSIIGLPLSPAYAITDNFTVQFYERALMEWHPDNPRASRVQLSRLGSAYLTILEKNNLVGAVRQAPARGCAASAGCETFSATNHTALGAFHDYWSANGGIETFGLPLTEEFSLCESDIGGCARSFSAQIFERNVFEWHPEVNGGAVLIRRLGALTWTTERRTQLDQNPSALRSVPDYDDVQTPSSPPPAVYTPPPAPAPIYSPPPAAVYTPAPPPTYSSPPQQSSGPTYGSGGVCPSGYPVKANDNSGIYHVPGGEFYGATNARNCFATTSAAEAAGYRASKR